MCIYKICVPVALMFIHATLCRSEAVTAKCIVEKESGIGMIEGTIELTQESTESNVSIKINLSGFNKTDNPTKHGFHVHAEASLGNKCSDAKGHLNLDTTVHGGPTDPQNRRHTGDLGNVEVGTDGNIKDLVISDWLIALSGDTSVIGKPIVIHEGEDDLGKGSEPDSNTTGHAGGRLGCCLIELSTSSATAISSVIGSLFVALIFSLMATRGAM